jgi:predicted DNA-binding transcriptional regulator AlpA
VPKRQLTSEVLIDLHRRLSVLPWRSHERRIIMQETARLYGISEQTLYRALAQRARPKALRGCGSCLAFPVQRYGAKQIGGFPFQGIPKMIYLDQGPVGKSQVFQQVMCYLGIDVCAHLPQGKDGRRATSRSKGPIPLYRYRAFKKTPTQQRADRIEALAEHLALPRAALEKNPEAALFLSNSEVPVVNLTDPDPFQEFAYPNALAAKRAIADYLGIALAKLPAEQLDCSLVWFGLYILSKNFQTG